MKTVKVVCAGCGCEFDKRVADYNRTERRGARHFCSLSCSVAYSNKSVPRGGVSNFHSLRGNLVDEYSPFRWFVLRAKQRSANWTRGGADITIEYLKEIWDNQHGICPWTGKSLVLPRSTTGWSDLHTWNRASLDRIDNSKGYVKGNVRFVSLMANFIKGRFSDEEIVEFCKAVVARG
jgi:hypothetical protein